jgi:DNA-binding winged helix-turn-helix (wHTH) protein
MSTAMRLILLDGLTHQGRQFLPLESFPFTIGRARECDLVVDSTQISRQHARLELDHEQVVLINGERLAPNTSRRLRAGDKINLAQVCTVEFDDPGTTLQVLPLRLQSDGLTLDEDAAQVIIAGKVVDPALSPGQFMLLALLVHNEGRVVSREEIRSYVWGPEEDVTDQTIDALVSRLRKRLTEADSNHEYVVTRRGFGLIFRNKGSTIPALETSEGDSSEGDTSLIEL